MKSSKIKLKFIALLFSILILFQGCSVYKSVPISLEQAVQSESKVRVKTKTNEKLKFMRIGIENGNYYGVKKNKGVIVKTPLDQDFINRINEKDKILSTVLSIAISVVVLVVIWGIGLAVVLNDLY